MANAPATAPEVLTLRGRCYCGEVRFEAVGVPVAKTQCHCRECQYGTGGAENLVLTMPSEGFRYLQGAPAQFTRSDLEHAVTREFCPNCGTQLTTGSPRWPAFLNLRVGTLDDPSIYGGPQIVCWTDDAQPFHIMPEGVPAFPGFPPRRRPVAAS